MTAELDDTRWFAARIVYRCVVGEVPADDDLYEESIRVVRALDAASARERAEVIGREVRHDYVNDDGEQVTWAFESVVEIQDLALAELRDGSEVFTRLMRSDPST